jgi:hypothetical protein
MPGGNGTGPRGEGPMTGRGIGFCILKKDAKDPSNLEGFIGIEGKHYKLNIQDKKEVIIMPGGDGTGPAGLGPMTGRAAGYCAGYPVPGYMNPIPGRGFGLGRGGWGRRNWFYATGMTGWQRAGYGYPAWGQSFGGVPVPYGPTREQETDMLKTQAEYLQKTISEINKRIQELEAEKQSEE